MSKSIWFHPISIEDFKDSSINMDKHLDIEIVEIGDGSKIRGREKYRFYSFGDAMLII